jgi:hypothetical protein
MEVMVTTAGLSAATIGANDSLDVMIPEATGEAVFALVMLALSETARAIDATSAE